MTEADYLRGQLGKARMAAAFAEGVLEAVLIAHPDVPRLTIEKAIRQLQDARKGTAYPTQAQLDA